MSYYFSAILEVGFDDAVSQTKAALATEGFGIISEIDIQEAFREKIAVDFRRYTILGACNPSLAYEALQLEDKVGTMLPCNVVVQEIQGGVEVAAVNPLASMQAIKNEELAAKASVVAGKLQRAIDQLTTDADTVVHAE